MLWLALHCPTLSLDCILRRWPEGLEPALAVTDLDGSRRLIAVATRKAQACGVFAGQSVATALSLLPDLVLIARKLDDERAALVDAALAALRFTPTVSLRASGLVMEVSSSLKLFGGRRLLKKSIASAMQVQGLTVAAAEAPTPHGAWLLAQEHARQRRELERRPTKTAAVPTAPRPANDFSTRLDALPIGHLESARPSLQRLDGIGCRTLADLRRLPVKGLARRFGPALIDELARAMGDKPDPQVVFEAPSCFGARIELMARVETAEALVFASQRLLAQMSGWLTARRAAVRGFTLVLHHDRWTRDPIEPTTVSVSLATPSSDLVRLTTLVRERLSRLELKAPVLELAIEAPAIVEEREAPGTLFPERQQASETLARLLEKLTARLGPEAMMRLERVADHRPERAWREVRADLLESLAVPKPTKPSVRLASTVSAGSRHESAVLSHDLADLRHAGEQGQRFDTAHGREGDARSVVAGQGAASPVATGDDGVSTLSLCPPGTGTAAPPATGAVADPDVDLERVHGLGAPLVPVRSPGCMCGPRPVWLLAEPVPLGVRAHRPIFESLPLELLAGPERIETGWWDDDPATRDYFIGENAAGRLVWIYRERLPIPGKDLWYLQGLFG